MTGHDLWSVKRQEWWCHGGGRTSVAVPRSMTGKSGGATEYDGQECPCHDGGRTSVAVPRSMTGKSARATTEDGQEWRCHGV